MICFVAVGFISLFLRGEFQKFIQKPQINNPIIYLIAVFFLFSFAPTLLVTICIVVPALNRITFTNLNDLTPFTHIVSSMLLYYIVGGILHEFRGKAVKIHMVWLIAAYMSGALGLYMTWYLRTSAQASFDAVVGGYSTISGIVMAIALFLLLQRICAKIKTDGYVAKITDVIGSNTLAVYYLHSIMQLTFMPVLIAQIENRSLLLDEMVAIFTVVVCALIGYLVKKTRVIRIMLK